MTTPRHLEEHSLFSTKKQHVNQILHAISAAYPDKEVTPRISILAGGNSGNPVYKVEVGEIECVARITNADDKAKAEHLVSRHAGQEGIAPKVIYPEEISTDNHVMITEFIGGTELTPINAKSHLNAMLDIIKRIHKIPITQDIPIANSLFTAIEKFSSQISFENSDSILATVNDIRSLLRNDTVDKTTFVHNDLNVSNCKLNANGEIKIFDWGDGGLGDPLEELAHFTNFFGFTPNESTQILNTYLGKDANEAELAHFHLLKDVSILRIALATATQACKKSQTSHFSPNKNAETFNEWYTGFSAGINKINNGESLHKAASALFKTWELHQPSVQEYIATLQANQRNEFVMGKK